MAVSAKILGMDLDRVAQLIKEDTMPLLRTDFSSDDAWQRLTGEVKKEADFGDGHPYAPNVEPISDPGFEGITPETLADAWPRETHGYVMLADERSMREATSGGELTIEFVDLYADEEDEEEFGWVFGRAFRCEVSEVASIEANLSIANMDFEEFADGVGDDGVFRGF